MIGSGFILNMSGILRRTLFALALLALSGTLIRPPGRRPLRLDPGENRSALSGYAETYLRQTARLLAGRFDEHFYQDHVRRQMGFSPRKPRESGISLEPFIALGSEGAAGADEALAFLEEIGGEEASLPSGAIYSGGNPVNAFAGQLAGIPLSSPRPVCASLRPLPQLRGSDVFPLFFLLLTALAAFFRGSPLAALFGAAAEILNLFFAAPVPKIFLGSPAAHSGCQLPESRSLSGPPGEKKVSVLRC